MPLGTDVADLEKDIAGKFALDGEIVLRRILRAKVRRKLPEEQDGPIQRPVHGNTARWSEEAVGDIGLGRAVLANERRAEQRIGDCVADSERRLGDELLENKLLDGIVKKAPAHAHGGLVGTASKSFAQSIVPRRAPI